MGSTSSVTILLVSAAAAVLGKQTPEANPPLVLNPERAHIAILHGGSRDIRLYDRPNLSGLPAIQLNELGLFVRGALVCSWPGGRYDPKNEANMVLGYTRVAPDTGPLAYVGCPSGIPVISTWGDRGLGAAALYIEVAARNGSIVETRYQGGSYYLDLNALPGDPREPEPSFNIRLKGFLGWEWLISENESARLDAAAVARLLKVPSFAAFLRDARACMISRQAPECLASFVRDPFYYPDAAADLSQNYYVTPIQFARYAWQIPHPHEADRRLWSDVTDCFSADRMRRARDEGVQSKTDGGFICELERGLDGWKLMHFTQGE